MIIPRAIEAFYGKLIDSLMVLKYNIDQILGNIADSQHAVYIKARIKPKESLMTKIEKEGCKEPAREIEDLVACRLIVKSNSEIPILIEKIKEVFKIESENVRTYRPNEFIYDDIQLILSFKDNPLISNKEILGKKFELQLRTGLQDALSEAIRNEIYKTDSVTWQKERTASELRANLELVDFILSNFPEISSIQEEKEYRLFLDRNEIVNLLKSTWTIERLPEDLRRASIVTENYLKLAETNVHDLRDFLSKHPKIVDAVSITPCQIILIILFLEKEVLFQNLVKQKGCLLITDEMIDLCTELRKIDQQYRVNID